MIKPLVPLVGVFLISGCIETAAIALVTAPVWLPIEYGVSQSNVKQPVEIVTAEGKTLSTAFAGEREALLVVQGNAVVCTGTRPLGKETTLGKSEGIVSLSCNKGLKGRLDFDGLTTSKAIVTVGPASAQGLPNNKLSEVSQRCEGNFNKENEVVAPFLLECKDGQYAALSPKSSKPGEKAFTVWLPPR